LPGHNTCPGWLHGFPPPHPSHNAPALPAKSVFPGLVEFVCDKVNIVLPGLPNLVKILKNEDILEKLEKYFRIIKFSFKV